MFNIQYLMGAMELPNTPKKGSSRNNSSISSFGADYSVQVSCTAVINDLPTTIPCVEYQRLKVLLPSFGDQGQVPEIIEALKEAEVIVDGRWAEFPTDPWKCRKENTVFSKLFFVIDKIVTHAQPKIQGREPISSYVNRPHAIPVTSDKAHKKEPDGYFLFLDHTSRTDERHFWRDAVTPAEFKRKDTHTDLQDVSIVLLCLTLIYGVLNILITIVGTLGR